MKKSKLFDLDSKVQVCEKCYLSKCRHITPNWTSSTKYLVLVESPIEMEQKQQLLSHFTVKEEELCIIGTVQCIPYNKGKKIKPADIHREMCKEYVNGYIKEIKPKKMIAFGNIPMYTLTGKFDGIIESNASVENIRIESIVIPTVFSISPFSVCYNKENLTMLKKSISKFEGL